MHKGIQCYNVSLSISMMSFGLVKSKSFKLDKTWAYCNRLESVPYTFIPTSTSAICDMFCDFLGPNEVSGLKCMNEKR